MRKLYLPVAIFSISLFQACQKLDPEETIPAFIYVDHVDLQTTSTEGSTSHGIEYVWVFVDDNPVGVFELPARIPVLKEGEHKLGLYGGVKRDGIAGRLVRNPFYQGFIINNYNFIPGNIDTLDGADQPFVTYFPSSQMELWADADFEVVGTYFVADPSSDTVLNRETDFANVFEGTGSGSIILASGMDYFKAVTNQNFDLPIGGIPIYVEFNYKTNNHLRLGVQSHNGGGTINTDNNIISPSYDENGNLVWKKFYADLTEVVGFVGNADYSEIYFRMIKDDDVSNPAAYIDNIKVMYGK